MIRPLFAAAICLIGLPALAQGPPGSGPGDGLGGGGGAGGPAGMLGLALVMPPGTSGVTVVAQRSDQQEGVAFTDDGSIALDMPGDGEWWALLNPSPGATTVHVSGLAEGGRIWHTEQITVPSAWRENTYPITLLASRDGEEWTLTRTLAAVMPEPSPKSGSGISEQAARAGIPAPIFYLSLAIFMTILAMTASLRSAILRARRPS